MISSGGYRDGEPVDDEDGVVVAPHVAEQPVDREEPGAGRGDRADDERPHPAGREVAAEDILVALQQDGAEHDRDEEQEREPRRRVAREARGSAPAVIVIPERETPGSKRELWASPTRKPRPRLTRRSRSARGCLSAQ